MPESPPQEAPLSRAEGKRRSRQKLLTSTINSIAKRGFAETTLARVAEGAGLSRGIVNFHFRSKEILFLETLKFMTSEYRENWLRAFNEAGPRAAERLEAVLMAEFEPPIANRNRIAVWFAFYGEAKSRPTYMSTCTQADDMIYNTVISLCQTLIKEGEYENRAAEDIAFGITSMVEGLSLDLLLHTGSLSLDRGKEVMQSQLRMLFPQHFPLNQRDNS
jgi:TetR/AcrR family transcriptional repressor of bet genes